MTPTSAPPRRPPSRSARLGDLGHRHRPDERDQLHVHGQRHQRRRDRPASATSAAVTPRTRSSTSPTAGGRSTPATPPRSSSASSSPPTVGGQVTGIRFYKAAANTGTHVGSLWSATANCSRQATFTNETASGWQTGPRSPAPSRSPPAPRTSPPTSPQTATTPPPANGFATADRPTHRCTRLANSTSTNGVYAYSPPAPSPPTATTPPTTGSTSCSPPPPPKHPAR